MTIGKRKKTETPLVWISRVAGRTKLYIVILLVIQIVLGISGVCYAMLLRNLVNAAAAGTKGAFMTALLFFVLLVALQIALRAGDRHFQELSCAEMENRLKQRLFSTLLTRDYASVAQINSGEWMNRLTSDTAVTARGMTQILPGLAGMVVRMAAALAALLFLEPRFLYILVPGGILLVVLTYGFRRVLKRLHKKIQEADGVLRVFLQERLGALMVVRSYAQEDRTLCGASQRMQAHKAARMKRNRFSNICNIGFNAAMNGAYILGVVFCGFGILNHSMSYGDLLAVLQLIGQIQTPFANISGYLPQYYAMLASAERLMEAEAFAKDCREDAGTDILAFYRDSFCGVALYDASFTYLPPVSEGQPKTMPVVFTGLNMEIAKGSYTAFTGPSGCGKSTVLKLLMSLYPLDAGERCLLTDAGKQPLDAGQRRLFAYVPQGNQLMSGSIREIIAFSDPEKMQEEARLKEALRLACAEEFVQQLEHGMDTVLGERGTGLSEGQMQRIAIARAIFSEHPILLLDEATSALDETTEAKLLENLKAMTDKTVIIVTHRPAVLSICDNHIDFEKIRETSYEQQQGNA